MAQLTSETIRLLLLAATFCAAYFFLYSCYLVLNGNRLTILGRLAQLSKRQQEYKSIQEAELDMPFFQRVIHPVITKMSSWTKRLMPAKKEELLHKKLIMAGNPGKLSAYEFTLVRYVLGGVLGLVTALLTLPLVQLPQVILLTLLTVGIGLTLPLLYLNQRATNRKKRILEELPDALDLLTISVEAGLGFDGAIVKVVEKSDGVLAGEFLRVLQEIKKGKARRVALRDLAERCQVEELSSFVGSVVQADQLGVSISNVLRVQAEQMRVKRRQRAEEKAMKAPVKMLIPLVFFIFPTIFIVLLGPAAIQMLEAFKK